MFLLGCLHLSEEFEVTLAWSFTGLILLKAYFIILMELQGKH